MESYILDAESLNREVKKNINPMIDIELGNIDSMQDEVNDIMKPTNNFMLVGNIEVNKIMKHNSSRELSLDIIDSNK